MANTLKFGTDGNWATKKGSTLAYNSENGNFKPLPFTFDRAGSATRVNKEGLIEVVSNNEPRIDFLNDSKGALLLEPNRSNRIEQSNFESRWFLLSGGSIAYNQTISPDGTQNASVLSGDGVNGNSIYYSISLSVQSYTFSIFAKQKNASIISLKGFSGGAAGTSKFNLSNGTIDTASGGQFSDEKIEDYGNGWYRCSVKVTATSSGSKLLGFGGENLDSGELFSLYGAQLEQGSYATSYIPTQGSIGTRVAESCSQTPPDGIIGQTEGTVFLDSKMALQNILNYQLFSINNGGNSDRIRILTATGNRLRFIYQLDGGTTFYSFYNPTDYGDLTNLKIAFTYKSGDIKVYINGVLADSSTNTFTIAEKLIDIDIATSAGGYNQMLFNDIKLYNTALTDQELINLTKI